MIIRNNTNEPLAVRVEGLGLPEGEDELLELEPGEEEDIGGLELFLEELIIEPSSTPHLVSEVAISGN